MQKFSLLRDRKFSSLSRFSSRIIACVQQGFFQEALCLYSNTLFRPLDRPNIYLVFPSLLKACAALSLPNLLKSLHSSIFKLALQSDPFISTSLINGYSKCATLGDAIQVFDDMPQRALDPAIFNSIIDACSSHHRVEESILLFREMQSSGIRPDAFSVSIILGACAGLPRVLEVGRMIHGHGVRAAFVTDPFIGTALIDMYAKCGRPLDAWLVFCELGERNTFGWNAMIGGFFQNGMWERSLELFATMKNEGLEIGEATLSNVLSACTAVEAANFGQQIHCSALMAGLECTPFVSTSLLTMYAKCMLVRDAYQVFEEASNKEIELWNALIAAYVGNNDLEAALDVYMQMGTSGIRRDSFMVSNILSACGKVGYYDFGRQVHGEVIKRTVQGSVAVESALLTMYSKCGSIEEAYSIFNAINEKDVVAWGSMIWGFCQNREYVAAVELFCKMNVEGLKPDSTVVVSMIKACTGLEDARLGCQIHGLSLKSSFYSDVYVNCALIDMYAKCRLLECAEGLFSGMKCKNIVAWNSLISGFGHNGQPDRALSLFAQIIQDGLLDSVSITTALKSVATSSALFKGKEIHGLCVRNEIQSDYHVDNALIDMYTKSGCLQYAHRIFDRMPRSDLVAWNSMIAGYGSHGYCIEAIGLFYKMLSTGVLPDEITFLALISSCNHAGLVEDGMKLFQSMVQDYRIVPGMEHHVNMVDLWGRAGYLNEAYHFIQSMPIEPDSSIWLCLLSACRVHHNVELGELAADKLFELEPERSGNYVQLLNLYGEYGLWDKIAELRMLMKERGIKKSPGCSWIELRNIVDVFFSGDSSSSRTVEIHDILKSLRRNMKDHERFFHVNAF